MTDKEKVLMKWKDAVCEWQSIGEYRIFNHGGFNADLLGTGNTESDAWADAAEKLN